MDMWIGMAASVILTAIKESVKNKTKKKELKAVLLKIRNAINDAYAGDKDFA